MLLMQAAEFKADRKMFNAKAKKWTLQHAEGGLGGGGLNAADNTVGGGSSSGSSAAASGGGGGGNGSVGGHADGNRKPPMGTASVQTVREFPDCFLQLKTFCFFYLHLRECIIIIILIKYASSFTELRFPGYLALICCASITACSGSLCHFIEIILLESILFCYVCACGSSAMKWKEFALKSFLLLISTLLFFRACRQRKSRPMATVEIATPSPN